MTLSTEYKCEHFYKTSNQCKQSVIYTFLEPNKKITHVCKHHISYWNDIFSRKKYKLYVRNNNKYMKIHQQL